MDKILALFVLLLIVLSPNGRPAAADAEESHTSPIPVGVLENWPPYYSTDPKTGIPEGFAIEVMNKAAELADLRIHFRSYKTWPELNRAFAAHQVMVVPNMGITAERLDRYDFTAPYETFQIAIFVRRSTTSVRRLNDLAQKKVGVVEDNKGTVIMMKTGGADLVVFPSLSEAFMALLTGNTDALVYPEAPVRTLALNAGLEDAIKTVGAPLLEVKRAIAIIKGEPKIYQTLDKAVSALITSQDFVTIYEKWFGKPKPFWNAQRVLIAMGIVLALSTGLLLFLRHRAVTKSNAELSRSIDTLNHARQRIAENEALLKKSQAIAHVGSWRLDVQQDALYCTDEVYRILGLQPGATALSHSSLLAVIHPDDRDRVAGTYAALDNNGHYLDLTYRIRRPDGSTRFVHEKAEIIRDESGPIALVIGVIHDISELKKSESELRQREATLDSIFKVAPVGIGMGVDRVFSWANASLLKMLGYDHDDLIGSSARILYSNQSEFERVGRTYAAQIENCGTGSLETQWLTAKGDTIDVLLNITPINFPDRSEEVVFTVLDISAWKKAENLLKESERNYREIFNAVNDVLLIHDKNTGQIIDANAKVKELYGYTPGELYGQTVGCLSLGEPPFGGVEAAANVKRAVEVGPHLFEWRARHKSGQAFWVEVNLKLASIGGAERLLAVVRDIDQRKANEIELKAYREHLEELVKSRTAALEKKTEEMETFTYSVSHDLKAPLRGIDGYSRLLADEYADKLDEEGLQFLANIRSATEQMHQLIEDLLAYSRMERQDLRPIPVDIQQLIDELLFERQHEITSRSIHIATEVPPERPVCDRESLRQILGNFLDNAIKFTISTAAPQVVLQVLKTTDGWRFSVKDNGIGFDPKYQERIFGIFQRLHHAEDFPGTGVGLAIVKKAASRMGARTWAESSPGRGATFYVEIPQVQSPESIA